MSSTKGTDIIIKDGVLISSRSVEPLSDGALIASYSSRLMRLENEVQALAQMCIGLSPYMFEPENDYVKIVADFVRRRVEKEKNSGN